MLFVFLTPSVALVFSGSKVYWCLLTFQKDRTRRNLALLVQRAKGTIKVSHGTFCGVAYFVAQNRTFLQRFCKRWRDKTKQKKEQRAARIIYRTLRRWFLRRTYERKQRAARVLLSTLRDIAVRNKVTAQIQALHAVVVPIQRAWRDFVRRRGLGRARLFLFALHNLNGLLK